MSGRTPADNSVHGRRGSAHVAPASHPARGAARGIRALLEVALLIVRAMLWVGFTAAGVAFNMWGAVALLLLLAPESLWGYIALALGAAVAGCAGGVVIGLGQVLALRRWLDGAASLGSFLSAVLASSAALCLGTTSGWWLHTVAGELIGALVGLVVYGSVFGFLQRPMLDYLVRNSLLWVLANAAAAVLGALAMLAAFDVSGGRRDTLQFKYVGVVYALVTGVAFLWMTRETRRALAAERDARYVSGQPAFPSSPSLPLDGAGFSGLDYTDYDPDVLEIHEHRIYQVHRVPRVPGDPIVRGGNYPGNIGDTGDAGSTGRTRSTGNTGGPPGHSQADARGEPDVIDTTFRVLP